MEPEAVSPQMEANLVPAAPQAQVQQVGLVRLTERPMKVDLSLLRRE